MTRPITIGFFSNELNSSYQLPVYRAFKSAIKLRGWRMIVYEGRILESEEYSDKEHNEIYRLFDDSQVDAVVTCSGALANIMGYKKYGRWLTNITQKPVISLNAEIGNCYNILIDNSSGIAEIVKHLADDHGYERIAFVTGPSYNHEAKMRFEAFKASMLERNIFYADLVVEADLKPKSGVIAIKKIVQETPDIDAIVFANDEMAISALDYLNVYLPEYKNRYAITGFDNSINSDIISPRLTSVSQPFDEIAKVALDKLEFLNSAEDIAGKCYMKTGLKLKESCGCQLETDHDADFFPGMVNPYKLHENIQSFELDEFFNQLEVALSTFLVKGCWICRYVESPDPDITLLGDFSELVFAYSDNQREAINSPCVFERRTLLPLDNLQRLDAVPNSGVLCIKTLFFQRKHLGYVVFDMANGREGDIESIREHIATNLNISILFAELNKALSDREAALVHLFTSHQKLKESNSKLDAMLIDDELTSVLNRRGFYREVAKRIENLEATPLCCSVFYSDLDSLKQINDNFGHAVGDIAIHDVAQILKSCFDENTLIGRVGGDEFIIFDMACDPEQAASRVSSIKRKIDQYNVTSEQPFKLSLSIGTAKFDSDSGISIEQVFRNADANLYQNKKNLNERAS